MRTIAIALSLIILTAIALSGCNRVNGAAPKAPQKAPPAQSAPAPKDGPDVSEGWIMIDPTGVYLPNGFTGLLRNEKLNALMYIGPANSALYYGAHGHAMAMADQLRSNGVAIGEVKKIEEPGLDAAWVPFDMKRKDGPPVSGGFAAKTSTVDPEITFYFLMVRDIDPAGPDPAADIERCRKDLIGFGRAFELPDPTEPIEDEPGDETPPAAH